MGTPQSCPVTGLQKILFATDGSLCSEAALRETIGLSKACVSKLYVLSVIEVNPEYESLAPAIVEKADNETKEMLENVKKCASQEGISCETIVHRGEDPAHFIVEEAKKLNADMIVMGRHGKRSGITKLLLGSVTQKVIGHATCKVLAVPA